MIVASLTIRPEWIFLAGCALLTIVLVRRSYRRVGRQVRRGKSVPPLECLPRPKGEWDGACRDAAAHISRQKVELYDLTRATTGVLDSKILVLEQLIATSDRQIERMEQLLDKIDGRPLPS